MRRLLFKRSITLVTGDNCLTASQQLFAIDLPISGEFGISELPMFINSALIDHFRCPSVPDVSCAKLLIPW